MPLLGGVHENLLAMSERVPNFLLSGAGTQTPRSFPRDFNHLLGYAMTMELALLFYPFI